MFEGDLTTLSTTDLLESAAEHRAEVNRAEGRLLEHAQIFADRNHPDTLPRRPGRDAGKGRERGVVLGGDGCPEIAEFAPAEFGAILGISTYAAAAYIGQALALRHRFPHIWAKIQAGTAAPWRARKIAAACEDLSEAAAASIDKRLARCVDTVTPQRLENIVKAAQTHADPEGARVKAEQKARERGVYVGRSDEHGTKTIFIRTQSGHAIRYIATISSIAEALKIFGDTRSVQTRRAEAVGIIADSRYTQELLTQAQDHLRNTTEPPAPPTALSTEPSAVAAAAPTTGSLPATAAAPTAGSLTATPTAPTTGPSAAAPAAPHSATWNRASAPTTGSLPATPTAPTTGPLPATAAAPTTGPSAAAPAAPHSATRNRAPAPTTGSPTATPPPPTTGSLPATAAAPTTSSLPATAAAPTAGPFAGENAVPAIGRDAGCGGAPGPAQRQIRSTADDPLTEWRDWTSDHDEPSPFDEADRDAPHPADSDLPDPLDILYAEQIEPFDPGLCITPDDGQPLDAAAQRALHTRLAQIKHDAHTRHTRRTDHPTDSTSSRADTRLRPGKTEIYVHLTDHTLATGTGVLRAEGLGPLLADQLTELVGHGPYTVKPVIDLNNAISVDAYEITDRIRERVRLIHPVEVFPYGTRETNHSIDLDHIQPYDPLGPPRQTGTTNLAPLGRFSHRVKTHADGWTVHRVDNTTLEWTTPHGFTFHVTPTGTHRVPSPSPHPSPSPSPSARPRPRPDCPT